MQAVDKETKLSQVESWGQGPTCHLGYIHGEAQQPRHKKQKPRTRLGFHLPVPLTSFHRTSTSIIRGSLYSNSLPWASILGESYSHLFHLMFHFHHCSTFTLVSTCLKLLPTTSANKAAAYLHAQLSGTEATV